MEGRWCCERLLQLLLLTALSSVSFCSLEDEITDNQVVVRFDNIFSIDDWSEAQTEGFTTTMTSEVNTYCGDSSNFDDCDVTASGDFTVVLSADSPEYFNGDIKMTFHVLLPSDVVDPDASNEYVLQKSTLFTIVNSSAGALRDATNKTVVFIDSTRLVERDTSLDAIMIPVSCVLFLIVVFIAIILSCMQSRGEKKRQLARESAAMKKGEESITLTAVKTGSYNSDENNEVKA